MYRLCLVHATLDGSSAPVTTLATAAKYAPSRTISPTQYSIKLLNVIFHLVFKSSRIVFFFPDEMWKKLIQLSYDKRISQ